jgi:spermidine dehydrogenase
MTTYWTAAGKLHSVRSKTVLMATPQMVNRNVCLDLPREYQDAMAEFNHPPMLKVNVAVRNWRFMEKAGITAFKWWGDYPAYGAILRSMIIEGREIMPCDPTKPTVIPLYIPANATLRGVPLREQAFAARHLMFSLRFADIEMLIRQQFTKMFAPYGFDAERDIAGIVANRWGHAFICPGPGFFTGKEGRSPPSSVIKKPLDAMAFSHSDLSGLQDWHEAARFARAGVEQLVQLI